jgi:hypothetical protein
MEKRTRGFVLGKDDRAGIMTWRIMVTDQASPLCGQKLFVVSIHESLTDLQKGLEVTFIAGAFGGSDSEIYHQALEVMAAEVGPKCDYCKASAEFLMQVTGYDGRGGGPTMRCCLVHIMRAIESGQSFTSIPTKQFLAINIGAGDHTWRKLEGLC